MIPYSSNASKLSKKMRHAAKPAAQPIPNKKTGPNVCHNRSSKITILSMIALAFDDGFYPMRQAVDIPAVQPTAIQIPDRPLA